MTGWRWGIVAWSLAVILLVTSQGWGVIAFLLVWVLGLAVLGGMRMAFQR